MSSVPTTEITGLLQAWSGGDTDALERIVVLVYPELRKIAKRCLASERTGHTLQATALVNEAYLRLIDIQRMQWHDRAHFFAVGARLMRRILVDYARSRGFAKRGGGARRVDLNEALIVSSEMDPALVRMDDALTQLAAFDPRKAKIVEMRYFGGLNADDIASVLGVSPQTVNRDWSLAKAWLAREMSIEERSETPARPSNRT
ncbi:MAG TPA: sigma-70 family RNA polymerase sigma factor [Bryobacteraceae bacterium]|nr:sigma-70 family RNA polymerase sigma factor [Bryobacteraceae bacterium]